MGLKDLEEFVFLKTENDGEYFYFFKWDLLSNEGPTFFEQLTKEEAKNELTKNGYHLLKPM